MNFKKLKLRLRNKIKIDNQNNLEVSHSASIKNCKISIIGNNNNLIIDENCTIRNMEIEILGEHCTVHIGARTTNTGYCKISCREKNTQIIIGTDCLFANNVMLLTSDGHDIYQNDIRINYAKDIILKNHVWLAENVMVLKGSNISHDCIIGANSVVTGSHKSNTIAAGNPAKTIKSHISWHERLTY